MKYLAILRDSWREALDSKVLYFMLGLSCLVILVVACVGYQPEPAEAALREMSRRFAGAYSVDFRNPEPPLAYEIDEFVSKGEAGNPWEGEYEFTLRVKNEAGPGVFRALVYFWTLQRPDGDPGRQDRQARERFAELLREAEEKPPARRQRYFEEKLGPEFAKVSHAQMERFVREQLAAHGNLEVSRVEVKADTPEETRLGVATRGKENTFHLWLHTLTIFSLPTAIKLPIGPMVYFVEDFLVGSVGAALVLLVSTIVTAFFIPNMLRRGTIDLLLSKPIHRVTLLVYKYLGGLLFMVVNTVFVICGLWVVLGLRSGLWGTGFLLMIFVLVFQFAFFYAVSTLFGVLTRSPIVSILAASISWALLFGFGLVYNWQQPQFTNRPDAGWGETTLKAVHFVLPRYKDLDKLTSKLLMEDLLQPDSSQRKQLDSEFGSFRWGEAVGVSGLYIVALLGLASWRFATRDY